jgi:predicted esterase
VPGVVQSHGRQDFVLPFVGSGWLKQLLLDAGLTVEYHAHDGAHDLGGMYQLEALGRFLAHA